MSLCNKRVLFFVNDLDFFISHRLDLANEISSKKFDVYVASNTILKENKTKIEFKKIKIDRSNVGLKSNLSSLFSMSKIIFNLSPAVIHNVSLKPILFASLISFLFPKIKVVNAVSGLGYLFTSDRNSIIKQIIFLFLRIILKRKNTHYVFQNGEDLKIFKHLGLKSNYSLIKGSGVDAKDFLYKPPKEKEPVSILCTARMLKDKGIIELIEACKYLAEKGKHFQLTLLGKIDLENPAHITEEELINSIDIPQIEWFGFSNEVKLALENCHIYCLPSYREGLPKAIVEALAIGRPIITTTSPGCDDCVIEGVNGFKVPRKDIFALAEKLELLINDPVLRLKMGKASRKFFEKEFTLKKIIKQHMEIYNDMLN